VVLEGSWRAGAPAIFGALAIWRAGALARVLVPGSAVALFSADVLLM
jgi:hypothetical protein